jgi:hypothetical protein
MEGATRSGYYILNSQTEPESLRVAHCNMNLPFFDNQMEKDIGELKLGKPGVNFTNILRAAFSYESGFEAFHFLQFGLVFFWQKNICAKAARKMLVKLTTARFVVEQDVEIRWPAGANVTFAEVIHSNGWDIDISTGVFSPMRNGTYLFVLSGTALKTDSKLSMITKSGKMEDIFESEAGLFNLTETPSQISVYNGYSG